MRMNALGDWARPCLRGVAALSVTLFFGLVWLSAAYDVKLAQSEMRGGHYFIGGPARMVEVPRWVYEYYRVGDPWGLVFAWLAGGIAFVVLQRLGDPIVRDWDGAVGGLIASCMLFYFLGPADGALALVARAAVSAVAIVLGVLISRRRKAAT
jgi:hypothetical protein